MNGEELDALRRYLDDKFASVDQRFNAADVRLTGIDSRITTNADERLAEVEDLRDRLDRHLERNHEVGSSKTSKTLTGGVAATVTGIVIAVFEVLKRAL